METVGLKNIQSWSEKLSISKTGIENFLYTLNEKKQDISIMQQYCEKMWKHEEEKGTLAAFRECLFSLVEDMKKFPDLRIACFDFISKEAKDYLDVFPLFFEMQAFVNKSNQNPFATDLDYKYLKGNLANGIVVLYPQLHEMEDRASNIMYGKDMYKSQMGIYRDFLIQKPEHVYLEGITPSEAIVLNNYESSNCSILPKIEILRSIAIAINNDQELVGKEREVFMKLGGPIVYAVMSQRTTTPATLYPTMGEQEENIMASAIKGKHFLDELTDKEQFYVIHERETKVEDIVMKTADQRNGKPASIVMGKGHRFDNVFLGENSPAVYRREVGPFEYEAFRI
ncbi:MAG: hypothetical protein K0R08_2277 [Solimicrobium sp.]|jgi:hypothetical protein|nr:hypothetical protein [Solimicrobium sp.]